MSPSLPRISQFVTSSDGTRLYVDAVGVTDENIKMKPTIVFIHGFSMSGLVFDNLFEDQDCIDAAVLVSVLKNNASLLTHSLKALHSDQI